MPSICIDGLPFQYSVVVDKRRKSARLKLLAPKELLLTLPAKTSAAKINKLLSDHKSWILEQAGKLADASIPNDLVHGSLIPLLGISRTIVVIPRKISKVEVTLQSSAIIIRYPRHLPDPPPLSPLLKNFYLRTAASVLAEKTAAWKDIILVQPQRICLRDQKTRWGSCSSRGNINYNWRIIMAPEHIVDYLVVHELCHLKIPNHSQDFWLEVSRHIENYLECRQWLKTNSLHLTQIL